MNYSVIGEKMKAKKNLTDLLREEVEKSPTIESEKGEETTDDQVIEQNPEVVEKLSMNTPAKPSAKTTVPTKAELEETITELKAALEDAKHKEETFSELKEDLEEAYSREGALKQQISDLQADLQHQKRSVHKLEKELEKFEDLKTELAQAKKAAFQLAEANEKLMKEVNSLLKKENKDLKEHENKITHQPAATSLPNYHPPERPIQKESEKPADFAKTTWLL